MAVHVEIVHTENGAALIGTLDTEDGSLDTLAGATVTLRIKSARGTVVVNAASVTVTNATTRAISYQFATADYVLMVASGQAYHVQFKVVRADTKLVFVPRYREDRIYLIVNAPE